MADNKNRTIRVVELFAGVGGFRIGLEEASDAYQTIWSNQWEPSTARQDASLVYQARFGSKGHSNKDINKVKTEEIPDHDLLVGGFPCQDYSVASTLSRSGGIEGKKGVLWWQIYRILSEKGSRRPQYVFFENVDRLLGSPAQQRGRDFAIILTSLAELGYTVEWRVINAADYGMPQRRRRIYILGYQQRSVVRSQIESPAQWVLHDGVMAKAFPDSLDRPSRTIITSEGGAAPSRFKHVVLTPSGRYRRLMPIELERLNMFPDHHTLHPEVTDARRAFLMGNALMCGIVRQVGKSLYRFICGDFSEEK